MFTNAGKLMSFLSMTVTEPGGSTNCCATESWPPRPSLATISFWQSSVNASPFGSTPTVNKYDQSMYYVSGAF
jgi:hypothetical protein